MIDRAQPFHRPPRQQWPSVETVTIDAPPLPEPPIQAEMHWVLVLAPLMGFFAMALFYVARGGATSPVAVLPLALLAVVSIFTTVMLQRWRSTAWKQAFAARRRDYERAVDARRARLEALRMATLAYHAHLYPSPKQLVQRGLQPDERLWERRATDPDFMQVRVGTGAAYLPVQWRATSDEFERDPTLLALVENYRWLDEAPITAALAEVGSLAVVGRRRQALGTAYAIIAQAALFHAPQDLHIAVIAPPDAATDWAWAYWLPHARQDEHLPLAFDAATNRRVMGYLGQWLDARRAFSHQQPHLLLIVDEPQTLDTDAAFSDLLRLGAQVGVSVLCVTSSYSQVPGDCTAQMLINADHTFRYRVGSHEQQGTVGDALSRRDVELVARVLAPITLADTRQLVQIPDRVDFMSLYSVQTTADLARLIATRWERAGGTLPRPVPIGRETLLNETFLMLSEDAHGPHGMLAGTTGAGKSELLQSLVCALAVEHDPRDLTLLLIDFKGGSTFNVFAPLPHTVGLVTNLEPSEVRRMLEALRSEVEQRQQFLKAQGLRDIQQYYRQHAMDPARALPHLVIVVDEFAQLAREMPDFLSELVKTAQIGRSLGLHLILGTQSPMDVITDELNANLQFRICLRVQNADASRAMLRRPDAAYLPVGKPGRAYLQVGERGLFKQFQAAYSGGLYQVGAARAPATLRVIQPVDGTAHVLIGAAPSDDSAPSVAHAVVETVAQVYRQRRLPAVRPLLLPTLPTKARLTELHARLTGGFDGYRWLPVRDQAGQMVAVGSAPIGLVDDLAGRTQRPLWIHLNHQQGAQTDGHLLIVGAPATGKTTLMRTLALSLAALHPPEALHLYFLSFTGSSLNLLGSLPHAEQVVIGTQTERVRRLFGRFVSALDQRLVHGAAGQPHLVLFIDQYEQFRDAYRDAHGADLERLINEGRAVNVYVVLSASTIHALPDRLRAMIQQRVAFQQANPSDYALVVGRLQVEDARHLPPGRCYVNAPQPLLAQVYLPVLNPTVALTEPAINDALVESVAALRVPYVRSGVQQAPLPLSELPQRLNLAALPTDHDQRLVTTLGLIDDDTLSPYRLDWRDDGTHFVVVGAPASGKTNLLHLAALRAAELLPPSRLRLVLIDLNQRSLRALEPLKHTLARVTELGELRGLADQLAGALATAQQQGESAAATVVLIDDYDLLADALLVDLDLANRLRHLVRYYGDVPFHVWAAGSLDRASDAFIKQLLLRRSGFGLMHRDALQRLNLRTAHLPAETMPPGRAFVPRVGGVDIVQLALVQDVPAHVARLNDDCWAYEGPAVWGAAPLCRDPASSTPAASSSDALDIDTAGLIDDLLNDLRGKPS